MRQGITGLIAGLIAGTVLAGGAAFATGMVVPASPAPSSTIAPRTAGPVAQTRSASPTHSAEATHTPDVKPPVAADSEERPHKSARTRDRRHAGERSSRSSQPARRRSSSGDHQDASRGTVCAPAPAPDHQSGGGDPDSGDHEMGEHRDGMGHE